VDIRTPRRKRWLDKEGGIDSRLIVRKGALPGHLIISVGQRVILVADAVVGSHPGSVHLVEFSGGCSGVHILCPCCDIAVGCDRIGKVSPIIRAGEVG